MRAHVCLPQFEFPSKVSVKERLFCFFEFGCSEMSARVCTFLVVRRRGRNGDVKPLRQRVGVPDGELLSRLDISQRPVENLEREERKLLQKA